jgi:hypothetical protein
MLWARMSLIAAASFVPASERGCLTQHVAKVFNPTTVNFQPIFQFSEVRWLVRPTNSRCTSHTKPIRVVGLLNRNHRPFHSRIHSNPCRCPQTTSPVRHAATVCFPASTRPGHERFAPLYTPRPLQFDALSAVPDSLVLIRVALLSQPLSPPNARFCSVERERWWCCTRTRAAGFVPRRLHES